MRMNIRERLDSLSRGELAGLVAVVVVLLVGVGVWYTRSLPRPIDIATDAASVAPAPAPSASVLTATSVSPSAGPSAALIVDVAGWVRKPGVFDFEPGDRVIDAVERAGGARDNADLTLLNLAAPLGRWPADPRAEEGCDGTGRDDRHDRHDGYLGLDRRARQHQHGR